MKQSSTIACASPFVPPEWIAAHGLTPAWMPVRWDSPQLSSVERRGLCPWTRLVLDAAVSRPEVAAVILTTTCDQMRHAAALLEHTSNRPAFLLNVPATWQSAAAKTLYGEELQRLGRFLVELGGTAPTPDALAQTMVRYEMARREQRGQSRFRGGSTGSSSLFRGEQRRGTRTPVATIPLALVGGPLPPGDNTLFNLIAQAGGRVVLDATETGERTWPRPFDCGRLQTDPFAELADAYFTIPDIFRRPNDAFYEWLGREIAERRVRGILFRRYVWCDLWHAELARLRQWSLVPVLDLDVADNEPSTASRTQGKLEAFLEVLR